MDEDEIIKLSLGAGTLLFGNLPQNVSLSDMSKGLSKGGYDFIQNGSFEVTAPDFNKFYPDVKPSDLQPEESDYVRPLFRALSETVVHRHYYPVDFSQNGALRNSTGLLRKQSVKVDHAMGMGSVVGVVEDTQWQDSYVSDSGILIPAGINARFRIDGKTDPKLARGVVAEPPTYHSTSVTVSFTSEPSHPSMTSDEFYHRMGTLGDDGELVRRIATEIVAYHEISFVDHGADPFAQIIQDGQNISNPEYAISQLSANPIKTGHKPIKYYYFKDSERPIGDFETIKNSQSGGKPKGDTTKNNNKKKQKMNEQLIQLAMLCGIKEYISDENQMKAKLTAKITELTELAEKQTDTDNKLKVMTEKYKALENVPAEKLKDIDFEKLSEDAGNYNTAREQYVGEATRLYKLSVETPEEAVIKSFEKLSFSELQAKQEEYKKEANKKMPLSCKSCGSEEVDRQTTASIEELKNKAKKDSKKEEVNLSTSSAMSLLDDSDY